MQDKLRAVVDPVFSNEYVDGGITQNGFHDRLTLGFLEIHGGSASRESFFMLSPKQRSGHRND